jgi:glycosyltransferase involved in cell wall biosynthesis
MWIYWYWPHPHREASPLALAVLRNGDILTVETLKSLRGERFGPIDAYEVVRDLPDPARAPRRFSLPGRRPRLTVSRSLARYRQIARGFDVAHIGMLVYQTDWADLALLRRRVPLVSSVHDVRPHASLFSLRLETALLKRTYREAGDLIVFHDVLRDELVSDFGVTPDRVHVVPHPLDARDQRGPALDGSAKVTFLFFGTLRPNKGLSVLVDALRAVGELEEACFVIAGEGDEATHASLHRHLSSMSNVRLELGRVSHKRKRELFLQASWVLLPYLSFHSQSGVLADAYAYRVPLIASDVGALGPSVRDDDVGLVVPSGDPQSLARAIVEAASLPPEHFADRLSAAAWRHDYSRVGPQVRAVFDIAVSR